MLDGKSVGVVFVGSIDQALANTIRRSVSDAGGRVALVRALRVPLEPEAVDTALRADPDTRGSPASTTASGSDASWRAS